MVAISTGDPHPPTAHAVGSSLSRRAVEGLLDPVALHSFPRPAQRYGASVARLAAISASQRSPFASSLSLSYMSSSLVSVANSKLGPSTIASTGQASWHSPQ